MIEDNAAKSLSLGAEDAPPVTKHNNEKTKQADLSWRRISTILDPQVMLAAMKFYPKHGNKSYMTRILIKRHIEELQRAVEAGNRDLVQSLLIVKAE